MGVRAEVEKIATTGGTERGSEGEGEGEGKGEGERVEVGIELVGGPGGREEEIGVGGLSE